MVDITVLFYNQPLSPLLPLLLHLLIFIRHCMIYAGLSVVCVQIRKQIAPRNDLGPIMQEISLEDHTKHEYEQQQKIALAII